MTASGLRRRSVPAFVAAAAVLQCIGVVSLHAAAASAWIGDSRSKLRLIAGTPANAPGFLRAGVEIRLAPGWKTYWRYPGDSGIAPRLDFSRSANVKSVEVDWPAPHAWRDASGTSIGYKNEVILPLRVVPQDSARPVSLALAFDYAICERVCILESGRAELQLSAEESEQDAPLAAAEARVPRRSAVGEDSAVAIRSVRREGDWPRPRIVVDLAAPAGVAVDLFAEGPTTEWSLPVPEPVDAATDGVRRFAFALDGAPPGIDPRGATLTLTAVVGDKAIEVPYRLD